MISYFQKSRDVIDACLESSGFQEDMNAIIAILMQAVTQDRLIMICGNGGSASDADHFAAELVCRYKRNRPAMRALALSHQGALATAISNDFGYEHIFSRQVEGVGRTGDVLIALSTSGKSPNVLKALKQAKSQGVITIGFTGAYTQDLAQVCDHILSVPSNDTPMIQQIHLMAYHHICDVLEQSIVQNSDLTRMCAI